MDSSKEEITRTLAELSVAATKLDKLWHSSVEKSQDPLLQELRLGGKDFVKPAANPKYLRLYGHYICPYVERTLLTLAFKKIPYQFVSIDFPTRPQWFRDLPSQGRVPLLELVNQTDHLAESVAICQYLDEVASTGLELMPKEDTMLRARVRIVMSKIDTFYSDNYKVWTDLGKNKETSETLRKGLEWFNETLKENKTRSPFFLDQPHVTIADILLLPMIRRMFLWEHTNRYEAWAALRMYELPQLVRWYDNMMMLPEVCNTTVSKAAFVGWVDWMAESKQVAPPLALSRRPNA